MSSPRLSGSRTALCDGSTDNNCPRLGKGSVCSNLNVANPSSLTSLSFSSS